MALELARYEDRQVTLVHQAGCRAFSTIGRQYQLEPIVRINDGWQVRSCLACRPVYGVVIKERKRMRVRADRQIPERFENRKPDWTPRPWPPFGPEAVDVKVEIRHDKWENLANCRSEDERLQQWMTWLWATDINERWPLTVMKVLCTECPVRAECLEEGVFGEEPWGIWGGATPRERRKLLKQWRREGRPDGRTRRRESVWRTYGSRDTTPSDTDRHRTESGESQSAATDTRLPELWPGEHMYPAGRHEWAEGWG